MKNISKIMLAAGGLLVPVAYLLVTLPREFRSSNNSTHVTGNLGGVFVSIPRYFADLVEYSPVTSKNPAGPASDYSAFEKRINSFGFYVRFPDMSGLSSPELIKDKRSQSIYTTSWISVGISSAENYYGPDSVDRVTNGRIAGPDLRINGLPRYEATNEKFFGLDKFSLSGVDPATKSPYKEHRNAEDIFVHRDSSGKADVLIICSNVPHRAAPCSHRFTLEPKVKAYVYIRYRRGHLKDWEMIQKSVSELILGFSVHD